MSLVNAECNNQLRPFIQISYQSSSIIKALNLNMNVDRTDDHQLNKEQDKHTRKPCPWLLHIAVCQLVCLAHDIILIF